MRFIVLLLGLFFSFSQFSNAQNGNQNIKLTSDEEGLFNLGLSLAEQWKADSTRAVKIGFPLNVEQERSTATFIGFDGNMPIYVSSTTLSEVQSYYGQDLWTGLYNLSGNGYNIGMWEAFSGSAALPNPADPNLQSNGIAPSRVFIQNSGFVSSHANNVAWRIAGDGQGSATTGQGIAYRANIYAWDLTNGTAELAANAGSLLVSNHSYAQVRGWTSPISITLGIETKNITWWSESNVNKSEDYGFGVYSTSDRDLDLIAKLAPYHCIVKSAANDRGSLGSSPVTTFNTADGITYTFDTYASPTPEMDGGADGFDCLPQGATSKNAFIIGACADIAGGYSIPSDVAVMSFSCFGPTDDGRIKPDFVAPGLGGTSYSAPNVTGAIILLQELYESIQTTYLKSATIKALLAQTAYEAGPNPGPDYKHGWGMINPKGAAEFIIDLSGTSHINEATLANGQSQYFLVYSDGIDPITATLSWTDPEITPLTRAYGPSDLNNSTSRLVNDLDMRLVNLSNVVQASPYILDPTNPANAATTGDNFRDNIEKFYFAAPAAGWYAIRINHKGTLAAPQAYSLIISGARNGDCVSNSLPVIDNTWNGATWASAFVDGQDVIIEDDLTLSGNIIFGDAIFNGNIVISIPSGMTLTITGNVWSFENVVFSGDGKVVLGGSTTQQWCGGAAANIVELNNANGAVLNGTPLSINNYLDVKSGTLNTNGVLTLVSAPGTYAQIHESGGAISGEIEFQQTVTSQGWHNVASPVATTIGDLLTDMTDFVIQSSGGNVYRWDAPSGAWLNPANTSATFGPTDAYNVYFGNSGSRTYSNIPFTIRLKGPANTGAVSNTVVYGLNTAISNGAGWNMMANPYPENLDWNSIKANFGGFNINNFYYVWDAGSATYKFHDGSSLPSLTPGVDPNLAGSIAPGQSFFVKLNDAAAQATTAFDFTNSNRTLNNATFYKSSLPQIHLTSTQKNRTDTYYVVFEEGNELGLQPNTDAFKLFSPMEGVPQIYQYVDSANSMALNFVGLDFDEVVIPVSYDNTSNGAAQIEAFIENVDPNWSIFLEDTRTNKWQNLRLAPYLFSHQANQSRNRFLLHINKTGTPEIASLNDLAVWGANGNMKLQLLRPAHQAQVTVINSIGEVVHQSSHDYLYQFEIPFTATGVFVVQVRLASGKVYKAKWVN